MGVDFGARNFEAIARRQKETEEILAAENLRIQALKYEQELKQLKTTVVDISRTQQLNKEKQKKSVFSP